MTVTFRPATRENVGLLISLAGASGSGKTYSGMRLAQGIVGPGERFAVIDTEARRALHYADMFRFDHAELKAPFTPMAYADAIQSADQAGYKAILIDSMSHEWEGVGGVLDWATRLEAGVPKPGIDNPRTYGGDWWKDWDVKPVKSPGNWNEPKVAHKRMMAQLLQCSAHLIICLRADDKIEITKDAQGKTVVIQPESKPIEERWVPICEKRFMYEMTASFVLTPERPGIPIPKKLQEQHLNLFPTNQPITEQSGQAIAQWARGSAAAPASSDTTISAQDPLLTLATAAARNGTAALRAWWEANSKGFTEEWANANRDALKRIAAEADATSDGK